MKSNLMAFVSNLTLVDYLFFFSVLLFLILIIGLIYFIKINQIGSSEDKPKQSVTSEPPIDLGAIKTALASQSEEPVALTDYEKEQEQKAIISYDELLQKNECEKLNYESDEIIDEIHVKKVDLTKPPQVTDLPRSKVPSEPGIYQKEEAFLESLKKLQIQLKIR